MNWQDVIQKRVKTDKVDVTDRVMNTALLYPPFFVVIKQLLSIGEYHGLRPQIMETYRDNGRQAQLYAEKKTKLCKDGMHRFGVACDVLINDGAWMPAWDWKEGWQKLGLIGKSLGLHWGGDWKTIVDCPHFQYIPVSEQKRLIEGGYPLIYGGKG